MTRSIIGILLFSAVALPVGAQLVPDSMRGRVTERVVSRADPARTYALYVPSSYDNARAWPVAFVMDPRGRALIPMERMRAAAERHGWIVFSSYDTRSDDPDAPNVEAVNAMLEDAQTMFRLDTKRFYLVGFSGTARQAWEFAARLGQPVAGILGAGADLHVQNQWLLSANAPRAVAYFGTAGFIDFNYDEVRQLEPWLDRGHYAWRTRYFEGGHEWPPEFLFAEAVMWFELQAMRSGRQPVRKAFVDSLWAGAMDAAGSREASDVEAAWAAYVEMLRDFRGLRDSTPAHQKALELSSREEVRKVAAKRQAISREEARYNQVLFQFIADLADGTRVPSLKDALKRLEIEKWTRQAAVQDDRETVFAARRLLELTFVNASFYSPRDLVARRHYPQALLMLDVADRIHEGQPGTALFRARALAQLGQLDDALNALERAVSRGARAASFEADSLLTPLRALPRYESILHNARGISPRSP